MYNNKGDAQFINVLAVVVPSDLHACVTFGSGGHADPFLLTETVKNILEYINIPLLGDSTFGKIQYVRGIGAKSSKDSVGGAAYSRRVELC